MDKEPQKQSRDAHLLSLNRRSFRIEEEAEVEASCVSAVVTGGMMVVVV